MIPLFDDFRVADAIQSAAATQTINGDLTVTGTIVNLTSVMMAFNQQELLLALHKL